MFAGSVAVTLATLMWTVGTWMQDRWIDAPARRCSSGWPTPCWFRRIVIVALGALPDRCRSGSSTSAGRSAASAIGLGYAAHSQLDAALRAGRTQYGAATSSLQLLDNLGVALGTGAAGVVVTLGDDLGWAPGDAVAVALGVAAAVAAVGLVVSRRLPAGRPTAVEVTPGSAAIAVSD